jgi:phospholipid/cholesterol/gamma-HCH transport system substrate-binding protein
MTFESDLKASIRTIPDYPKPGILFRDITTLLGDARATLTRVDGVLAEAQGIASNTRAATVDLGTLRAEVESSLRKVQQLVDEVNRKWPFARDAEVKLP